jgi:rod shape-determining protein MreD
MRLLRYAAVLAVLFVLSSAARWLAPQTPLPFNLFLVATIFIALFRSPMEAQLFGLAAGLIQDAFSNEIVGLNALSKTVLAYAVASLRQVVMIKGTPQRAVVFLFATLADVLLCVGTASAFNLPVVFDPLTLSIRMAANTAIGLTVLLLLQRRMEERSKSEGYEIS